MTNIFVFGSNLAGMHGAGSAAEAVKSHKAIYGLGVGLQGYSYAIPTKDQYLEILPLDIIGLYVNQFVLFAISRPDLTFTVVPVGCGLAGYTPKDIAPMFLACPDNVKLPKVFEDELINGG